MVCEECKKETISAYLIQRLKKWVCFECSLKLDPENK